MQLEEEITEEQKEETKEEQPKEKHLSYQKLQSKFAVFYQPHRLHPNMVFTDSGGRIYQVQADGSLKRINKGERAKPKK
jgi:thioredoxin-related protein